MRPLYILKNQNNFIRKFMADMAYIVTHKQIRLPRNYFEEGLFFLYRSNNENQNNTEEYFLTREKIVSEDENFYYFNFPFTEDQVVYETD